MPEREPRPTRPSKHVVLYRGDRWIRVPRAVAHIAKEGGWSETKPDAETTSEETAEHPVHVGGGIFELSDGNRIKGKDAALAAQASLDEQGDD